MNEEPMTLHDRLVNIQHRLKVPKDITNDFGGFVYRNLEDIEDKVKPFLFEHNLTLTFEDEIIGIEERVYVKAWAILSDGVDEIRRCAYAREAVSPKAKMDDAQLTGSCSSYARKYAAGGLFLIDNTKDADSRDNSAKAVHDKTRQTTEAVPFSAYQAKEIREASALLDLEPEAVEDRIKEMKTFKEGTEAIEKLRAMVIEQDEKT